MISMTNATNYNGFHNASALPLPTAALCGHKFFVNSFIFECKTCDGSYAWFLGNSSERLYDTFDISASNNDHVIAYVCGIPHCTHYSLYIGGIGESCNYLTTSTPPWRIAYGGIIESCYVSSGVTHLGALTFHQETCLTRVNGMRGLVGANNYVFGYGTNAAPIKQFIPDNGFDGFRGTGMLIRTPLTYVRIPESVLAISAETFMYCTSLRHIYIPTTVNTVHSRWNDSEESPYASPFIKCSSSLTIYCGANSKPNAWGTYWNYYDTERILTVKWGYTREQYETEVGI